MPANKITVTADIWRNGSDGEPQVTLTLPAGDKAWLRVPKSSGKAYGLCVRGRSTRRTLAGPTSPTAWTIFQWYKVELPEDPPATETETQTETQTETETET
jgi:hypothetical protein